MTSILRQTALLIIFTSALLLSFAGAAGAGQVEGIVISTDGPLNDAVVYAYPNFSSMTAGRNGIPSRPGEKPGQFRMILGEGSYVFIARGMLDGVEMFAYHGLNPVAVTDDFQWLPFFAAPSFKPRCEDGPQGIGGRVTYKGIPLTGGVISAYDPSGSSFRGMGLLTNSIDEEGRFWFDLEQGSYVLIARKRLGESDMGPLRKGDLFCYAAPNPVRLDAATSCEITIPCYPRDDLDAYLENLEQDPRGRREERRRTASLFETEFEDASRIRQQMLQRPVTLQGTVRDTSGEPVAGLYVSAYDADTFPLFQMFVIRLITESMSRTDENGRYTMDLEAGRTYYLVARERIGEAPVEQEYYGLYEGNANHSFTVGPGVDSSEVDIVVERIMP